MGGEIFNYEGYHFVIAFSCLSFVSGCSGITLVCLVAGCLLTSLDACIYSFLPFLSLMKVKLPFKKKKKIVVDEADNEDVEVETNSRSSSSQVSEYDANLMDDIEELALDNTDVGSN